MKTVAFMASLLLAACSATQVLRGAIVAREPSELTFMTAVHVWRHVFFLKVEGSERVVRVIYEWPSNEEPVLVADLFARPSKVRLSVVRDHTCDGAVANASPWPGEPAVALSGGLIYLGEERLTSKADLACYRLEAPDE